MSKPKSVVIIGKTMYACPLHAVTLTGILKAPVPVASPAQLAWPKQASE